MSESDTETDDTSQEGGASQDAPNESVQQTQSNSGSSVNDFVSEAEQEILKGWLVFVTGLNAILGVAIGLNMIIQDQWGHALISASIGGSGFAPFTGPGALITIGVIVVTLLGYVFAHNVSNEQNTAFKVAVVTALVGVPVISVLGGLLVAQPGNGSLELVNMLVSGLGGGIAGAVGSLAIVFLTENQAPNGLRP